MPSGVARILRAPRCRQASLGLGRVGLYGSPGSSIPILALERTVAEGASDEGVEVSFDLASTGSCGLVVAQPVQQGAVEAAEIIRGWRFRWMRRSMQPRTRKSTRYLKPSRGRTGLLVGLTGCLCD